MKKAILIFCVLSLSGIASFAQTYQWAKSIGSSNNDVSYSIAVDDSGNVYMTGWFTGTADFDPDTGTANLSSAGGRDIFFAKYNSSGVYQWAKSVGGTNGDEGNSITVDSLGNCYITGMFTGTVDFYPGAGTANLTTVSPGIFFAKYSASGVYQWAKSISNAYSNIGYGIFVDQSNNVYITGWFKGTADFDPGAGTANLTAVGNSAIFFAKYNNSGVYQWAKSVGGTGWDVGFDIAVDDPGNVYITGYFEDTADFDPGAGTANLISVQDRDIYFAKYNSSGVYQWAKSVGSIGYDEGKSITVDAGGNVYVTGSFGFTADFDPGPDTVNLTNGGAFFAKYDASGNYLWANSNANFQAYSIAIDDSANVYISGGGDIYFTKFNSNGTSQWVKSISGTNPSHAFSIAIDAANNVLITGQFAGTADFDPDTGTANLTSVGLNDIFFAKYAQCFTLSSFTPTATTICAGETINFTNTSTSATTFQWLENGILFSTATDTARTFNTAGTYTIGLVADSAICSDSWDIFITVNPKYVISTPDEEICIGDSVMIFGTYRKTTGTYYDSSTTVYGCDSIVETSLTANTLPSIFLGNDTICNGCSITLDAGSGFTNYNWSTGENTQTIDIDSAGTYTVQVTDANGCIGGDTIVVDIASGIAVTNMQDVVKIYPNPNQGQFTLEMELKKNTKLFIKLYHFTGQLIYSEVIDNVTGNYTQQIDLSKYAKGIYYVRVVTDVGVTTKKVIYQ